MIVQPTECEDAATSELVLISLFFCYHFAFNFAKLKRLLCFSFCRVNLSVDPSGVYGTMKDKLEQRGVKLELVKLSPLALSKAQPQLDVNSGKESSTASHRYVQIAGQFKSDQGLPVNAKGTIRFGKRNARDNSYHVITGVASPKPENKALALAARAIQTRPVNNRNDTFRCVMFCC